MSMPIGPLLRRCPDWHPPSAISSLGPGRPSAIVPGIFLCFCRIELSIADSAPVMVKPAAMEPSWVCFCPLYGSDDHPLSPRDRSLSGGRPRLHKPCRERGADPHPAFPSICWAWRLPCCHGHAGGSPWQAPGGTGGALIFVVASLVAAEATSIASFIWGVSGRGGRWSALHPLDLHRAAGCAEPGAPRDGPLLINGVICVIPVLAPVLGYLIPVALRWRGIFVGMALVAAISALVNLQRLLRETRPPPASRGIATGLLGWPLHAARLADQRQRDRHPGLCERLALVLMTTFGLLPPGQYTPG